MLNLLGYFCIFNSYAWETSLQQCSCKVGGEEGFDLRGVLLPPKQGSTSPVVIRQLLHICYRGPMLQEGSMIVTHLLHPGDRAVGNGNTNTMIISSLWNASRNVEHVILPAVVTHLK